MWHGQNERKQNEKQRRKLWDPGPDKEFLDLTPNVKFSKEYIDTSLH